MTRVKQSSSSSNRNVNCMSLTNCLTAACSPPSTKSPNKINHPADQAEASGISKLQSALVFKKMRATRHRTQPHPQHNPRSKSYITPADINADVRRSNVDASNVIGKRTAMRICHLGRISHLTSSGDLSHLSHLVTLTATYPTTDVR